MRFLYNYGKMNHISQSVHAQFEPWISVTVHGGTEKPEQKIEKGIISTAFPSSISFQTTYSTFTRKLSYIAGPYLGWITSRKRVGTQNEKCPNRDM